MRDVGPHAVPQYEHPPGRYFDVSFGVRKSRPILHFVEICFQRDLPARTALFGRPHGLASNGPSDSGRRSGRALGYRDGHCGIAWLLEAGVLRHHHPGLEYQVRRVLTQQAIPQRGLTNLTLEVGAVALDANLSGQMSELARCPQTWDTT